MLERHFYLQYLGGRVGAAWVTDSGTGGLVGGQGQDTDIEINQNAMHLQHYYMRSPRRSLCLRQQFMGLFFEKL